MLIFTKLSLSLLAMRNSAQNQRDLGPLGIGSCVVIPCDLVVVVGVVVVFVVLIVVVVVVVIVVVIVVVVVVGFVVLVVLVVQHP